MREKIVIMFLTISPNPSNNVAIAGAAYFNSFFFILTHLLHISLPESSSDEPRVISCEIPVRTSPSEQRSVFVHHFSGSRVR